MVTQKIRSRLDQTLDTLVDHKLLVVGEVITMKFLNQLQLMSFVGMNVLELVDQSEPDRKVIPVIGERRPVNDVMRREIEIPIVFSPTFNLENNLTHY